MPEQIVHYFVLETLSDWEAVFALAFLNAGAYQVFQAHPGRYRVKTVGESQAPITTSAGLRIHPDMTLDQLDPHTSAMLILPGATIWLEEARAAVLEKALAFLAEGTPVAAICGAVAGLARAGILDERKHTGNSLEELRQAPGYAGVDRYQDQLAITDGALITASAIAPLEFAYEIFKKLEVYRAPALDAWYQAYKTSDPSHFVTFARSGPPVDS